MLKYITRLLALFGFLVLVSVAGITLWVHQQVAGVPALPEKVVLQLELEKALPEYVAPDSLLEQVKGNTVSLRETIDRIDRATHDDRVKGLVVKIGEDGLGLAQVQEMRAAIVRFRASGRFAYAFSESFGEGGPGGKPYYLATAFDQIWLQPMGEVGLTGLSAQVPFLSGFLDMIGIEPEFEQRKEYKSAVETLTRKNMSAPARAETEDLLDQLYGQLVDGIAVGRKMDKAKVKALIDEGPFLTKEALDAKLVDKTGFYDEVLENAKQAAGKGSDVVELDDYAEHFKAPRGKDHIALIYTVGTITGGKGGGPDPFAGGTLMGSDRIIKAFETAKDDDEVKAIVFRIDSPGGSPVASEAIRHAVMEAKKAGKPVIVSMGDTAASGGYWVAMNGDKIVADPASITGSIGVFGGKFIIKGLLDKLGVTTEDISRGANAGIWSPTAPYTPAEQARADAMLDDIYNSFTRNVASARHFTPARMEELARGRVWTGYEAKANGLIDELGGLDVALRLAREAAHLPSEAQVPVDVYPHAGTPLQQLMELVEGGGAETQASTMITELRRGFETLTLPRVWAIMNPEAGRVH